MGGLTPFGRKVRELRRKKGISQRKLAAALGVSPAYLSALEHGRKGRPSWALVQEIIAHFGLIWDDAEEIETLARLSHPRVVIDTSQLSAKATEAANRMAEVINRLEDDDLDKILALLRRLLKEETPKA